MCGLLLLGGGVYTLLPKSNPIDFAYLEDVVFGGGMVFVGVMILAHFRWSPELFVGILAIPLAWSVWHIVFDRVTQNRLLLVVGPIFAMSAYWTLRKQIRPNLTNKITQPDDEPDEARLSPAARRVLAYLRSPEGQAEIERKSRDQDEVHRWKVMIELANEQAVTGLEIAKKASAAFGRQFVVDAKPLDPVDAAFLASEENGPVINGSGPHFFCGLPPYLFEITQVDRFLFVHYLPSATYSEELENGYRWTAKLAAEFVSGNPTSVTLGERKYRAADPQAIAKAMRSPDPEAALEAFSVDGDEPVLSE